jgi:hypothetical protein
MSEEKYIYKKEYCEQLINHMAKGLSFQSYGATIRTPRRVLYRWVDKHEEFAEAYEIGKDCALLAFEDVATKKSRGELDDESFKVTDTNMLKFMMGSRFRDIYAERKEIHAKVESLESLLYGSLEDDKKE